MWSRERSNRIPRCPGLVGAVMSDQLVLPFARTAITDLPGAAQRIREDGAHGQLVAPDALPSASRFIEWVAEMSAEHAVEAWAAIAADWARAAARGSMSPQTAAKYTQTCEQFIRHCALNGHTTLDDAAADVAEWIYSPVHSRDGGIIDASEGTLRLRRSAVQKLYEQARLLGLTEAAPTLDLPVPQGRKQSDWRPASDAEIERFRAVADTRAGTNGAVAFAVSLCGATTGEIGHLSIAEIDLDTRTLQLAGTSRTSARVVCIHDEWAYNVIANRAASLAPLPTMSTGAWARETLLIQTIRVGPGARQSSISQSIGEIIRMGRGGQSHPNTSGRLTPLSISAWAARKVFDRDGDIVETARFMGVQSLDLATQIVRFDWTTRTSPRADTGPGLF